MIARTQFLWSAVFSLVLWSWLASASAQPTGQPTGQPTKSQPTKANEDTLAPYLSFDRVSGMTKGAVTAMVQDTSGFMWFGTEEGLSRYDGYQFVNYAPHPQNSISDTVTALAADADSLWIGTVKGLDRLHLPTNKFTKLKNDPKDPKTIAGDYIVSLHIGNNGLLWIGTVESGVDSLNLATQEIRHYRSDNRKRDTLSSDAISAVFEAKDGMVWVGTRDAGLNQLDPKSGKVIRYLHDPDKPTTLSDDNVTSIFQDSKGALWVGTINALNRFDPATGSFTHFLKDAKDPKWVTAIVEGADAAMWLGVKGFGVVRLDRSSGAVDRYAMNPSDPTSPSGPWPRSVFSDRGGVLWIGFNGTVVSKVSLMRRDFGFYRTDPGLSFLEEGNTVWLGSIGRGLRSLDLSTGEVKRYLDEQLSGTYTIKIVAGDKGSLWIGTTDRGLLHFTPSTSELESYGLTDGSLKSDSIFAILRDGDKLWLGMYGAGLAHFDTTKKTIEYFASDQANPATLSSNFVIVIKRDRARPNILWVGTAAGLNEFDIKTRRFVRYLHDPASPTSLSNGHVTDIHEDRAGRLWIATWGGGLNLLDRNTGTFKAYVAAQGLASNTVRSILEDKTGSLWLTTNEGITKFDPDKQTFLSFRAGDGLQEDEFSQGASHQGASGRLYAGGKRGFNIFVPENIKPDLYIPPVVLTKFEILGEPRPIPDSVSLSFRDRWFGVGFSALAFASPERNHYKYRLTGFHDWIETDRRFVSYSSLPPGDYTLEIRGSNAHGVWNATGIQLPIHVSPPPWRTWWAYTSYGVTLLMIALLVVRRQRRQLRTLQNEGRLALAEQDLALTGAVQSGFLPENNEITTANVAVLGFYKPAGACSGDWWWHEPLGGGRHVILVGDVTGHGPGPAMVTAAVATAFRVLIGVGLDDVKRGLECLNSEVLRVAKGKYHMTMVALDLDESTGRWILHSAGGPPMLSLNQKGKHKVHFCAGCPLGTETAFETGILAGSLEPSERLLIYTDGIPEIPLPNSGNVLGMRRFAQLYERTRGQDLPTASATIVTHAEHTQAGEDQLDDWTFAMIEWNGRHVGREALDNDP